MLDHLPLHECSSSTGAAQKQPHNMSHVGTAVCA